MGFPSRSLTITTIQAPGLPAYSGARRPQGRRRAPVALRRAANKAWKAYVVLLTEREADYVQTVALSAIEEDLGQRADKQCLAPSR
jgi:hypothetical protein